MSDVLIDIYDYLVSIGKLKADMPMEEVMEYVESLPDTDQKYLLTKVMYVGG